MKKRTHRLGPLPPGAVASGGPRRCIRAGGQQRPRCAPGGRLERRGERAESGGGEGQRAPFAGVVRGGASPRDTEGPRGALLGELAGRSAVGNEAYFRSEW